MKSQCAFFLLYENAALLYKVTHFVYIKYAGSAKIYFSREM
ncbi:hypothetical protein J2W48_002205 [Flavobacterium piscis]|uniref:Uncharacterized protein n=1 Tax=Flavobacterium piscis TaxID=1114874 RepID=A0ABU1Y9E6_9FLAO|nr:hypothetical protein [Flavobacterium piscis]